MGKDAHKIGDFISKLRKEKGWTQSELAQKLQVSDKAISKWESNRGDPSIEFFPRLAEVFNVTIDYLMTGKEQENIASMSKMELCAKKDDVEMYKEFLHSRMVNDNLVFIDENNKTIFDYVFKYESKKLFTYIFDSHNFDNHNFVWQIGSYYGDNDINFFENVYYMRLLCNDTTVIRDLIRLEYKDTKYYNYIPQDKGIYYNGNGMIVPRKIISDRIIDMIMSGKVDKTITEAMLSNHSGNGFYTPALSLPYIIEYVVSKKDWKKTKELFLNAIKYNETNLKEYERVKENPYSTVYVGFVQILKTTYDILFEDEKYDLIALANNINQLYNNARKGAYIADDYEIQKNKINKSKMSDKEKQKMLCVHNGILNIDEVLLLKDFKTIKEMMGKYPICILEILIKWAESKKYKDIYRFAIDNGWERMARCIEGRNYKGLDQELRYIEVGLRNGSRYEQSEIFKYEQDNYKHISEYVDTRSKNRCNFDDIKSKILEKVALKCEKTLIVQGLNREYFENELSKGNYEMVIIKLCKKLEAIFKYDYHYEGTFEEMLIGFCEHFNTRDDESDDYDPYTPQILHALRKSRNSVVHGEEDGSNMSLEELRQCVDYICNIDKGD